MLFFRSEEMVETWCAERGVPPGPLVPMSHLWRLAQVWYSDRLRADARRPRPEEVADIFASVGLTEEFWDPQAGSSEPSG